MHPWVPACAAPLLDHPPETVGPLAATLSCVLHMLRDVTSSESPTQRPWVVLGEHLLHWDGGLPNAVTAYYQELATYDPQQLIIKQQQCYRGTCVAELEVSVSETATI